MRPEAVPKDSRALERCTRAQTSLQIQSGGRIRPEIAVMQTTSISGVTLREAVRSLLCFEMQGVCVAAASGLAVASECCPAERILSARLLLTSCTPAPCAV